MASLNDYNYKKRPSTIGDFITFSYTTYQNTWDIYIITEATKGLIMSLTTIVMFEIVDKASSGSSKYHLISTYTRENKFSVKYAVLNPDKKLIMIVHKQFLEDSTTELITDIGIRLSIDQANETIKYAKNPKDRQFYGESPEFTI